MPLDPRGEPLPGSTYHGFSGPGAAPPEPPPRPARRSGIYVLAGVIAAIALGLAFGFWARPSLPKTGEALPPGSPIVPIEVGKAAPAPLAPSNGKIQVLPPGAQASAAPPPAPTPDAAPQPSPGDAAPPSGGEQPPDVLAPTPPPLAVPSPRAGAGPDCGLAPPGAERMVCSDPDLRAEDRALRRAYRRALDAVDDRSALRADQRDWLAIREDAARHSRRALEDVYRQRIDELNGIADRADSYDADGYGWGPD
jgi:uncharacterized protein YecT (DUF1311 family)